MHLPSSSNTFNPEGLCARELEIRLAEGLQSMCCRAVLSSPEDKGSARQMTPVPHI